MTGGGRPLRFAVALLGVWVAGRIFWLWPTIDSVPAVVRALAPPLAAATRPPPAPGRSEQFNENRQTATLRSPAPGIPVARHGDERSDRRAVGSATSSSPTDQASAVPASSGGADAGVLPAPLAPTPPAPDGSRLSGSAWVLARGGASGTLSGGQLGASQAGARLLYALGNARRIALEARVATPLAGRGAEAAAGVEWRPAGVPARLVAEERVALDGGRGGPTVMAIGGGSRRIGVLTAESYAQAGVIVRSGIEGFADGAARLTRQLGRAVDLGLGSWGAVQRGAGRLDVGPTIGVRMPGGARAPRVVFDWRQRIAGRARPGSGPAVSVGWDF